MTGLLEPSPFLVAHVVGRPVTQGSKKAFAIAGKDGGKPRAVMVDDQSERLRPWRENVRDAVRQERGEHPPLTGPIRLALHFALPKPKSASKTRRVWPAGRVGDLDKLVRAVMDAMTDAGIWGDDSQVCDLRATKDYPGPENGQMTPGVMIAVWRIPVPMVTEPPVTTTQSRGTLWQ